MHFYHKYSKALELGCNCSTFHEAVSNSLVKSSSEQLVLWLHGAVDGGVGALCWGFHEITEGLGQGHQGTHEVPCYFGVDHTGVHGVSRHPKYCWA